MFGWGNLRLQNRADALQALGDNLSDYKPFNPLDKKNLGISVGDALLESEVSPLPPKKRFVGAGIYCLYYKGPFEPYRLMSEMNSKSWHIPIYVGKAVPKGARKGRLGLDENPGYVLHSRIKKHAKTITEAKNLELKDFVCRYLVVEDIWIPLGESLLVDRFRPLWNVEIDGFGKNDPGKGRYEQKKSPWDVLHPGRSWADKCAKSNHSPESVERMAIEFFQQYHQPGNLRRNSEPS